MVSKRRLRGLALAALVAAATLASPALAARQESASDPPAAVWGAGGESLDRGWIDRAWSWLVAVFGEENGALVPVVPVVPAAPG
jgi:ABC-type glycerol-3-phosphate transport system substrate-binding protein